MSKAMSDDDKEEYRRESFGSWTVEETDAQLRDRLQAEETSKRVRDLRGEV